MWSHYANKSKGICLEYEDVKSVYKMKYVKNQKYLKFYDFISIFIAFCIDSKINLSEKEIVNYSLLLNKSKDWAEEKEIRLLIPSKDKLISKIIADGKEMEVYPIGKPTKVILGAKISEENKHIISEYCKNNGIKMSVCKKKNYRIVLEDYSQ